MSRILVAEDEAALLEIFAEVLEDLGHTVLCAHDGEEALRLARLEPPDLVVSDHMMPRRTGVDLLRALRADPALARVPFVLTSAATPRGLEEADLFLAKPVDLGALEAAVRQLLPAADARAPANANANGDRPRTTPAPLREEMLNWVAHELKTPLTAARLKAQLLARRLSDGHARPDEEGAQAHAIVAQLDRMNALVTSLLDAARLSEGRVVLAPVPQDLCALLRELVAEWGALAPRAQFVLQVPAEPVVVPLDVECVRQVLGNVASNAVKYGGEAGRVEVRLSCGGALVRVDVVDRGPGIPAAQLPHVFERFHRLEHGRGNGHGLGLFIASQLARLHGGSLGAVSQLGEGATFTLRLPLARGV